MALEFWFEFGSTYSYPAAMRIESLCRDGGVALAWQPFLLGPLFAAQGWNDSPFNLYPAKGRYMWRDLERECKKQGIPLRRPSQFPRNGLLAARVATRAAGETWLPDFVRAVFLANFAEDRDIASASVIGDVLAALRQPEDWIAHALEPDNKLRLRAQTECAQALGIFGAPTCVVHGELFWGNDRLEHAVAWAREG